MELKAKLIEAEIALIKPKLIVCLGTTAAQSLIDPNLKISRERGRLFHNKFGKLLATVHPSSILRIRNLKEQQQAFEQFVTDLRLIHSLA